MFQNYEIIFAIGTLGAIFSLILLLIALIQNIKRLKVISTILTTIFVITFSIGISIGYFYYEHSKDIANQTDNNATDSKTKTEKIEEPKITSGSAQEPIVITEKTFSVDGSYYCSEFDIRNNTNIEISKISFNIFYQSKPGDSIHTEHIFLLDSVIPPNKTVGKNYFWQKSNSDKQLQINSVKLTKIQDIICYVNVNGEEISMNLNDLKAIPKNNK
jgi:hypothetical protein